jgi:Ca2+-binding EF-hand superfamily protein
LIDLRLDQVRQVLSHYDSDSDGILSYKEFLEVVLPKEHPELRAYVTQRECFDIKNEEYLSYETEAAMAVLFNLETVLFEDSRGYRDELHKLGISGYEIVGILDGNPQGSLNFDNIQRYLN